MFPTPASRRPPDRSFDPAPDAEGFLAALAAGLPPSCHGGFPLIVGVSGGGDSVGLLLGLRQIVSVPIVVAHAEHDLRAEAAEDRRFVAALAAELGLPFEWRPIAVRDDRAEQGEGLEARARRLRYAFLAEVAHLRGGRHVLVAHTADDQVETILHRILRGTGVAGLGGMRAARELCDGVALVRPLLAVSRSLVRGYLAAVGRGWREDSTNADTARARNFLRHELLPRCAAGPYPGAREALLRLGTQAGDLSDVLADATAHILTGCCRHAAGGAIILEPRRLAGLSLPLMTELVVALWRREQWPQRDMTASLYRRVATMLVAVAREGDALDGRCTSIDLPGSLRASAEAGGRVRIAPIILSPRPGRPFRP